MKPLTEEEPAKLTADELRWFGWMADTRLDCVFWNLPNVKRVIKRLLAHIRWLEERSNL